MCHSKSKMIALHERGPVRGNFNGKHGVEWRQICRKYQSSTVTLSDLQHILITNPRNSNSGIYSNVRDSRHYLPTVTRPHKSNVTHRSLRTDKQTCMSVRRLANLSN